MIVNTVRPHQMSWLRRPELDFRGREIWEKPNGDLYAHDPGKGQLFLQVMRDVSSPRYSGSSS